MDMRLHRKGQNVYLNTYTNSYNWVLVKLPVGSELLVPSWRKSEETSGRTLKEL